MESKNICLFCEIVKGNKEAEKVHENDEFVVIKNKFPKASVHLLILPKKHYSKIDTLQGKNTSIWEGFYKTADETVKKINIWPNFQLIVNAPGVAHFDHEHMHLLSGKDVLS